MVFILEIQLVFHLKINVIHHINRQIFFNPLLGYKKGILQNLTPLMVKAVSKLEIKGT